MLPSKQNFRRKAAGFSLAEIMVGMVIGLLGVIIMLNMLSVSENQKRTTSGGDDAQNAGAIALYGMQRDIQQSGYGTSAQRLIGCNVQLRAGVTLTGIAPVTINHNLVPTAAHDANTDTLLVVYGNANGPGEGDGITAQPTSPTIYTVQTQPSYAVGDYVIAQYSSRQTPCTGLVLDTIQTATAGSPNVTVANGVANIMTTNLVTGITPELLNLGQSPKVLVYAVRNGNLTVCDYMQNDCGSAANATINSANEAIWAPIAGNIVSLKAQYGRDTNAAGAMDGIVDVYDQTTPSNAGTLACDWARIPAVRLALVARGSSGASTAAAPTWAGSATNPIDLTSLTKWTNYRYKVFETTVPLRNITMQGVQPGC